MVWVKDKHVSIYDTPSLCVSRSFASFHMLKSYTEKLLVFRGRYLVATNPSGLDKLPWIAFNVEVSGGQG